MFCRGFPNSRPAPGTLAGATAYSAGQAASTPVHGGEGGRTWADIDGYPPERGVGVPLEEVATAADVGVGHGLPPVPGQGVAGACPVLRER